MTNYSWMPVLMLSLLPALSVLPAPDGTPAATEASATAQAPASSRASEPTPDRLIDSMLSALGGRDAISRIDSISVEANCTGPGGRFRTWVDSIRHDRTRFRQVSEQGETEIFRIGDVVWTMDEDGTSRRRPAGVGSFVAGHEFHLLLFELERRFRDFAVGEMGEVDGSPCRWLEMTDRDGKPATLCIAADHMPLELVTNPDGAAGPVRVRFADWSELDGVKLFWSFRLDEGTERRFGYRYSGIWINELPMTSLFVPPDLDARVELPPHRGIHHVDMAGLEWPQAVPFHEGPAFPVAAKAGGIGATVLLEFVVRADGSIDRVETLRCTPRPLAAGSQANSEADAFNLEAVRSRHCPAFVASAREAVARWAYKPGRHGESAVDVWFNAEVEFQ